MMRQSIRQWNSKNAQGYTFPGRSRCSNFSVGKRATIEEEYKNHIQLSWKSWCWCSLFRGVIAVIFRYFFSGGWTDTRPAAIGTLFRFLCALKEVAAVGTKALVDHDLTPTLRNTHHWNKQLIVRKTQNQDAGMERKRGA